MFASKLIRDNIPPLKPGDTCGRALAWMEEFNVAYLPLINGREFAGIISKSSVSASTLANTLLKDAEIPVSRIFVYENQHVYDVAKTASVNKIDIIPVLNNEQEYSGVITLPDLITYFAESKSVYMPGGIIILEMRLNDYTMSNIAQIVESDGAHILSASVSATADPQTIELTLKIDKIDLSRILPAFYRLNYNVTASYHQSESSDDLQNRYESLMHYLSIG